MERIPFEESIFARMCKKLPAFYRTWSLIHNSPQLLELYKLSDKTTVGIIIICRLV